VLGSLRQEKPSRLLPRAARAHSPRLDEASNPSRHHFTFAVAVRRERQASNRGGNFLTVRPARLRAGGTSLRMVEMYGTRGIR
jgi:hypothetical protein